MEITSLGYFLIPLGIFLFFLKNKYLFWATVFFAPFTASSILNIKSITFGIQPAYYFGMLFILKEIFYILKSNKIVKPNIFLLLFVFYSCFSLIMLLIFSGKIKVWHAEIGYYLLKIKIHNITQIMYLIFCFFIYIFAKNFLQRNRDQKRIIKETINVQIFSLLFVCIWGLYQFLAHRFNIFLINIFNQREGVYISRAFMGTFYRVNSVTPEPSMLAFYLCPMIIFILFLSKEYLKINRVLLLTVISLVGLFTISTSFLFGILVICLILLIEVLKFFKKRHLFRKFKSIQTIPQIFFVFIIITIIISLVIYFNTIKKLGFLLLESSFGKLRIENFSGRERLDKFLLGIKILKESNMMGVGFGTVRTTDLFSTLLANIGIVGFVLFLAYILDNLINAGKKIKISSLAKPYFYYFIVLFAIAFISVPELYFLFIWLNLSILEIIISYKYIKKNETKSSSY